MSTAKVVPSGATLAPSQSMALFVLQQLLSGLEVKVEIGGKTYGGYVHNLDFARGSDYVFAMVHVPTPDGEEEIDTVRVAIRLDGTVTVLPPDDKK